MSTSKDGKRRLEQANRELLTKYGKEKTLVGGSVWKLVKSVSVRFPVMVMRISRAILKWSLRQISEVDYFKEYLRHN